MFKIILFILVLFGAALYAPQTRPVLLETLAPIIDPILRWQTSGEMGRIVRELQARIEQGSSLPAPGEAFQGWMDRHFVGGASVDAWGGGYTLQVRRDSVFLVSNGSDGEVGTPDDLTQLVMTQPRDRGR